MGDKTTDLTSFKYFTIQHAHSRQSVMTQDFKVVVPGLWKLTATLRIKFDVRNKQTWRQPCGQPAALWCAMCCTEKTKERKNVDLVMVESA